MTLAALVVPVRVLVRLPEADALPEPEAEEPLGFTPIVVSNWRPVELAVPD